METVGEFLTKCAGRLAPFERPRVGRIGCGAALAAIAAAVGALSMRGTAGSWAAGFRFVILAALATVIALFVIYAALETVVERSVRRSVASYMRASGTELEALLKAAEMRSGSIAGGHRLLALLKGFPGGS
jgi:hypothetical protein